MMKSLENSLKNDISYFHLIRLIIYFTFIPCLILGITVLFGWITNSTFLMQMSEAYPPMSPISAISFIFSGISLACVLFDKKIIGFLSGLLLLLLNLLTITQYIYDVEFDINQLFRTDNLPTHIYSQSHQSPNAAVCFLLIAICLLLSNIPYRYIYSFIIEILCAISSSIAAITLFGYIFDIPSITSWYNYIGMAVHTSVGLVFLSLGIFLFHTFYTFYKEGLLYGPISSSICLSLYVTIFLWHGFVIQEHNVSEKIIEDNGKIISFTLKNAIHKIDHDLNQFVFRKDIFNSGMKELWKNDVINYIDNTKEIKNVVWIDRNDKTNWYAKNDSDNVKLEKYFKNIELSESINQVQHMLINNMIILMRNVYDSNKEMSGTIVVDVDVNELINENIPDFLKNKYNIHVLDNHTEPNITTNYNYLDYNFISNGWTLSILPKKELVSYKYLTNLILIAAFISCIFIALIIYLLQRIFQMKEKVIKTLKEETEALAYRQAILESSNYIIISTDSQGVIKSCNKAAERILGWESKDLIDKEKLEIFLERNEVLNRAEELTKKLNKEISPDFALFLESVTQFEVEEHEWNFIRKDGSHFPGQLSVTAIKDADEKKIGYVAIVYDLTEIKKIDLLRSEFIAITTHELRTPLSSMGVALDLLKNSNSIAEEEKTFVDIAINNCNRLIKLTTDILDLQKIEQNKMEFVFKEFSINYLLERAIEMNKIYAESQGVVLTKDKGIYDGSIFGDEDRLLQVVVNFISNAIKNSPEGGTITLGAAQKDGVVKVSVKDQGKEIPKKYHNLFFQKFSQVPSSKSKTGTGLGLSISKAIIEKHGGKIGFDTGPEGNTFWFMLY